MAKDYKKGDDFLLYLNTGSQATPTWALIRAAVNITFDNQPSDIKIAEAGWSDGHMNGLGDNLFSFTLQHDKGDANVLTMIAAIASGAITELAIADAAIATVGTVYWRIESVLRAPLSAQRGEAASWDVTAYRHINSVAEVTRNIAA